MLVAFEEPVFDPAPCVDFGTGMEELVEDERSAGASALSAAECFCVELRLECSDSSCLAETMKLCQINAGNVPPSTGPPSNWVVIGISLFG